MATAKGQSLRAGKGKQKKIDEMNSSQLNSSKDISENDNNEIENISAVIKEIRDDVKKMLKKEDIEALISKTVTDIIASLEKRMKEEMKKQIDEKCKKLNEEIEGLKFENGQLKRDLDKQSVFLKDKTAEFDLKLVEVEKKYKEAIRIGNQNEQYSRKKNVKIMNVPGDPSESEDDLTKKVLSLLNNQSVEITKEDILAIHRIPTKNHSTKPFIIKTKNNNVKSRIMRKRKEMKGVGHRIIDDVTRYNTGLISRLNNHDQISSAWFYNGGVFGRTHGGKRIKFELFDNINEILENHQ